MGRVCRTTGSDSTPTGPPWEVDIIVGGASVTSSEDRAGRRRVPTGVSSIRRHTNKLPTYSLSPEVGLPLDYVGPGLTRVSLGELSRPSTLGLVDKGKETKSPSDSACLVFGKCGRLESSDGICTDDSRRKHGPLNTQRD